MNNIRFGNYKVPRDALVVAGLLLTIAACGGDERGQSTVAASAAGSAVDAMPQPVVEDVQEAVEDVQASVADAGGAMVEPCMQCHEADGFAGREAADVAAALRTIEAGEMKHPPLPAGLSGENLAKLAAELVAGGESATP
jgi:hypothetical protein